MWISHDFQQSGNTYRENFLRYHSTDWKLYCMGEENKGRENYIDNNSKENYASYASLFNYSMQTIKRLPSHASGLKVINFEFGSLGGPL